MFREKQSWNRVFSLGQLEKIEVLKKHALDETE